MSGYQAFCYVTRLRSAVYCVTLVRAISGPQCSICGMHFWVPLTLDKVVDVIVGLRANVETEREGLDITEHTERANKFGTLSF
jgi:ammonia channel protein AmtB